MNIQTSQNPLTETYDTLVTGLYLNNELSITDVELEKMLSRDNFEGKFLASYVLNTPEKRVLVMGLGDKESYDHNKVREICAKAQKILTSLKSKKAAIALPLNTDEQYEHAAIGFLTGEYAFDKYKSKKSAKTLTDIYLDSKGEESISKVIKIAQATALARDLSNSPAQDVTPKYLAQLASNLEGVKTKIYKTDDIEKMGMGAFLAVSKASTHSPRFIHMHYKPKNAKKVIALIGKGITFDSGGLDLKPAASMLNMRDDMSGAANILAVMSLLNEFKPEIEVHGIIAACENMIGSKAYKPGDILTAKNGKTIEVDNTDAEGRLTLADALCFASELNPDEIIDIATLTGACMVALGSQCAGLLGNNKDFMNKLQEVGAHQGEKFWQLPMFKEYFDMIKSDIADMKNTGGRWGGASTAGVFLQEFVGENIAWAHFDIAGTAFLDKPQKELIKGATGIGIRTIINYILGE